MPTRHFVTYALLDRGVAPPITRVLDVDQYLDYLKNRTLPGLTDDLLHALERLWSSSAAVGSERAAADIAGTLSVETLHATSLPVDGYTRAAARCAACHAHLPLSAHTPRDLARHTFMVGIRDFMDPWTFNLKNMMKCCVGFLIPDGRMIPFCAYNSVGYRERVTRALTANGRR